MIFWLLIFDSSHGEKWIIFLFGRKRFFFNVSIKIQKIEHLLKYEKKAQSDYAKPCLIYLRTKSQTSNKKPVVKFDF
jgi:hypothetical protein